MRNKKIASILRDIEHYFGFLYEKGYKIGDADYTSQLFGNWTVELKSSGCVIYITNDRNYILLEFSRVKSTDTNDRVSIGAMIYLLSEGQNFVEPFEGNLFWGKKKQFERLANLLKMYIDQIEPYFGDDFGKYNDDLMVVQKKYDNLSLKKHATKTAK